jgi:hypothetical protein
MSSLICNGLYAPKFQSVQICSSYVNECTLNKFSVCKTTNLKLLVANIVILMATKIVFAYFNKTRTKQGNKKMEINKLFCFYTNLQIFF